MSCVLTIYICVFVLWNKVAEEGMWIARNCKRYRCLFHLMKNDMMISCDLISKCHINGLYLFTVWIECFYTIVNSKNNLSQIVVINTVEYSNSLCRWTLRWFDLQSNKSSLADCTKLLQHYVIVNQFYNIGQMLIVAPGRFVQFPSVS